MNQLVNLAARLRLATRGVGIRGWALAAVGGRSFVMRAVGNNVYAALRFLTPDPIAIGDRVSWDFDATGSNDSGVAVGDEGLHVDVDLAGARP
jgi:hypothetical protein